MPTTEQSVIAIICEQYEKKADDVTPNKNFADDLDIDSLDVSDLAMKVEDAFGIIIKDDEVEKIVTVSNLIDLVGRKLAAKKH
ncbi:MAG: acyl carrier protein [Patescibacteria group bacterium]|jgi:acyl carrier protein